MYRGSNLELSITEKFDGMENSFFGRRPAAPALARRVNADFSDLKIIICVYLRKPARHHTGYGKAGGSASYLTRLIFK